MKKVIAILLLGVLICFPLVLAQEQVQTYSNFNRFTDNVKLFFSGGDNKVQLALEIREKEVNSAIENTESNNEDIVNKNLENAMEKLIVVQEKVSPEFADEVQSSVNEVVEKIEDSNLSESFDRYILEEKKTQLVAELVIEINGTEGQTLTREVVRSENENRRTVRITVQNENGEIEEVEVEGEISEDKAVWEVVGEINGVENEIGEWVVGHTYAEGTTAGGESGVVVEGGKQEVKIYVAEGGHDEESVSKSDLSENHYDSSKDEIIKNEIEEGETKNEIVEGDGGEGDYAEGTSASEIYEGTGGEGSSVDE